MPEAFAVFVIDGFGHGQRKQTVGVSVEGTEGLELVFHGAEGTVVLVVLVQALHVSNGVVGTETGQGVYVAVCVVTGQVAVIQPEHLTQVEAFHQVGFDVFAREGVIAIRSQQAGGGGEQGTFSVAFNGTAFEHEVAAVDVVAVKYAGLEQMTVDEVVLMGGKLHAPAVEAEVEQLRVGVFFLQGDESMVAGPGVVCRTFHKSNLVTIGEVGQAAGNSGATSNRGWRLAISVARRTKQVSTSSSI